MNTRSLRLKLSTELRHYVDDQIRTGRYEDENEVVRDALRQMQQRELDQFERFFGDYPGAPKGEPTKNDELAIAAAVKRYRDSKRRKQAA